jgi:HlyD family secretion protein
MDHIVDAPPAPDRLPMHVVGRAPEASRRSRRGRFAWLAAAAVLASAATVVLLRPWSTAPERPTVRLPEGNVVTPAATGTVVGLGKLLPESRIVSIAPPFGAGDARIAQLGVEEGSSVPAGALLAVLDSAPALQAALAAAEATVASREASLAQTIVLVTTSRDAAAAALIRAEATIETTARDLDRAATLNLRGAAADQVLDQRRLAWRQAQQDAASARASLARYDAPSLEQQADVVLARRQLDQAHAELDRARADLDKAFVRAPVTGTVLTIHARPGERPGEAGLMSFGGLDAMLAQIEVYETEAGRLAVGDRAVLSAGALPAPIGGRITRIGREVLRQTLTDASPAANTDTRVLRVTVALDPDAVPVAARFANLQVTARFTPGPRG